MKKLSILSSLLLTLMCVEVYAQTIEITNNLNSLDCMITSNNIKNLPNIRLNNSARIQVTLPRIRVAYIIPSNRTAQVNATEKMQYMVMLAQAWYKENMKLNGFGNKTFNYETENNSNRPKINIVNSNKTDTYMRGSSTIDRFNNSVQEAQSADLSVWSQNEVWFIVTESHLLNSDGTRSGDVALGASNGSGSDAGVCVVGSDWLAFFDKLTDNTPYKGQILPALGSVAMISGVTFGAVDGDTFSSCASSFMGGVCHEMGHAFGLPHDNRNDTGWRSGNIMSNGFRGIRGSLYPALYPTEYMRLQYAGALYLNTSHYFNTGKVNTAKPTLNISTTSPSNLVNGQVIVSFTANDSDNLVSAFLILNGDMVGEMKLNTTIITSSFQTSYYNLNQTNEFKVIVLDSQGNRTESTINLFVQGSGNQAPKSFIDTYEKSPNKSSTVLLLSNSTTDANDALSTLQVQWDINNDDIYDTGWLNAANNYSTTYTSAGNYLVKMKVKDPNGAEVISTPVSLRVADITGDCRYIMPPVISTDTSASSIFLTAKGCPGTVRWSDGLVGIQRTVSKANATVYTALCELPYNCMKTYSTACTPTYSNGCNGFGIGLNGVTIDGTILSTGTGCSTGGYISYATPVKTLIAGQTYNFTLTYLGNSNGIQSAIWLDLWNNGTSVKLYSTTSTSLGSLTSSFTMPTNISSINNTKLRIVTNFSATPTEPCGNYGYGETEDYLINIYNPICNLNTTQTGGTWNTASIWSCGHVPLATEPVQISSGHTIILNTNGVAKSLDLRGILQHQNFSLQVKGN